MASKETREAVGVEYCRNENENGERCGERAEFIVWGKLFPPEALGPRCYDCAFHQVGPHGLRSGNPQSYAIHHLPDLPHLQKQFRDELRDQLDGLDWQAVNTDAEQQCPSRDHRPFACAKCVTEAALKATPTATEEAE